MAVSGIGCLVVTRLSLDVIEMHRLSCIMEKPVTTPPHPPFGPQTPMR